MAVRYALTCDDCDHRSLYRSERAAQLAGRNHACPPPSIPPPVKCGCCGYLVSLLVDDSDLCIRCDAFHFPLVMSA